MAFPGKSTLPNPLEGSIKATNAHNSIQRYPPYGRVLYFLHPVGCQKYTQFYLALPTLRAGAIFSILSAAKNIRLSRSIHPGLIFFLLFLKVDKKQIPDRARQHLRDLMGIVSWVFQCFFWSIKLQKYQIYQICIYSKSA